MEKTNRFKTLVLYLIGEGVINSQKELADKLDYPATTLSQIINGRIGTSEKFIARIKHLQPNLNENWLLTGEGEMLLSQGQTQHVSGTSNITQQNHHGNNTVSTDDRLLSILEEQGHQLTTSQAQLTTAQEQITQLLTIISNKL